MVMHQQSKFYGVENFILDCWRSANFELGNKMFLIDLLMEIKFPEIFLSPRFILSECMRRVI